jgi:hypothetical protein
MVLSLLTMRRCRDVLTCAAILSLLTLSAAGQDAASEPQPLTFEKDVSPILQAHCHKCHGSDLRKAGLDLRRRFTIVAGGDSGAAIVPGKPERSLLIEMIQDRLMPPEEQRPLDAAQIDILRRWIAAGAPTAEKGEPPLEVADAELQISDEDRRFWAFQSPARPEVPQVKAAGRVRTPIDALLLAKLESKGLSFNPDADKLVLLRRLCFDLHGLPPTPQQIDEFAADDRADAYERLVDRLLDSPRYGERWARHWLDIAGYADSDGYLEADRLRPEAWRYRDYVIRALNDDKPYDRFVLEQLAGDELADWRRADELTPEMIDNLLATGFLRTASDPTYANYKEPLECHKVMADTMEIVSSAFLGMTVQCARCHAHKMEPITQRDYYALNAIFLASYDPQRWLVSADRTIPLATEPQKARIDKNNQLVDQRVDLLNKELTALVERFRDKYLDEQLADVPQDARAKVKQALLVDPKKRNDEQKQLVATHAASVAFDEPKVAERFADFKTDAGKLRAAIAAESALKTQIVSLRGLIDLDDKPASAHILVRGDHGKLGAKVEPNVPAVLTLADDRFQPMPGYKSTGRRKALADWLVDPRHPLTARVQVNRMWAHHFGGGLVTTVANFGRSGNPPSHSELLDWLATEFVARGWSQKEMHKLMLNSTAYRQASDLTAKNAVADPENVLLSRWQPQRHEGEVVRDSMLQVAGKLNLDMFGQPVPVTQTADAEVVTSDDAAGNRRSIYLIVRRSQPLTLLNLFDTPRMEINCPQRDQSIVVTQALTLLNSALTDRVARSLSERIWKEAPTDGDAQIDHAYKIVLARKPTDAERQLISQFIDDIARAQLGDNFSSATEAAKQSAHREAWFHAAQVLLNSNEFVFVH